MDTLCILQLSSSPIFVTFSKLPQLIPNKKRRFPAFLKRTVKDETIIRRYFGKPVSVYPEAAVARNKLKFKVLADVFKR